MKVDGPRATEASGARRTSRMTNGQPAFSLDGAGQTPRAAQVSAPMSVGAIDSILALQAAPDTAQGRSRAVKRGQTLLNLLDELRDGLLAGGVSQGILRSLSAELQVRQEGFLEPGLQSVMNDIEVRAQVELAKMRVLSARSDSACVA